MVATAQVYHEVHPEVEIVWEKRSLQAFADRPIETMADECDFIVMDHPHVGEVARNGALLPLDGIGRDAELNALKAASVGTSHVSYHFEGRQWALAIDAAAQIAAWRPDLVQAPPEQWADVIRLAEQGRVLWPIKPVDAVSSFFTLAANLGAPAATEGDRLIAREDGRAVLDAMAAIARLVPAPCRTMNPIQVYEWLSGDDGFAYCPLLYGYNNYARPGYRGHLVCGADIPALANDGPRGSQIGGTGLAISARCKAPEIAVDYAFWVAGEACQRGLYFQSGGQPGHGVAWDDDAVNAASSNFFRDTRRTMEESWLRPRYAGFLKLQDKGGDAISAFLDGATTREATLDRLDAVYRESRQ